MITKRTAFRSVDYFIQPSGPTSQAASRIAARCESEGCKVIKGLWERIQGDCKCVIQLEAIDVCTPTTIIAGTKAGIIAQRDVIVLLDEKENTLLRESYLLTQTKFVPS
ncbi:hypothetical protein Pelo_19231 [Pelomyxa schiedti]|nr:hypothetical protein Pelo_19231 [Pelomyxa schiedti]